MPRSVELHEDEATNLLEGEAESEDSELSEGEAESEDSELSEGEVESEDAMSTLSCSRLETTGIYLTGYADSLATGRAAQELAIQLNQNVSAARAFFGCLKPKPRNER